MNKGRLIGLILSLAGLGIAVIAGLWLAVQVGREQLTAGGAVLGAGLAFIPVALLIGIGLFLFIQGGKDAEQETVMRKQRRLLDIVRSRGQISISDTAIEMGVSADTVREMVHQLVGLQVFSGYANWKEGMLYSVEASQLREMNQCRNCGGAIELVGKGIATCRFCGTEYFLS